MANQDLGTIGTQIGYAVEAFTRRFVNTLDGERAATRVRLSDEIAIQLLAGGSPERILADLCAAIKRLDAQAQATP